VDWIAGIRYLAVSGYRVKNQRCLQDGLPHGANLKERVDHGQWDPGLFAWSIIASA
jgi:hypothetical protein